MTAAHEDYPQVLAAEVVEVTRQESRVDAKAAQVAALAGTLSTLAAAAGTGLGTLAPGMSVWVLVAVGLLLVAAGLWAAAVAVLLRRVVRPRLTVVVPGSFVCAERLDTLRAVSLADYRESVVSGLGGLVLVRYRAVRLAVDLLLAGFVPLLLAVAAVTPVLLRTVTS